MSFFDRNGAGTCSGGEALRPALEVEDANGALADLTGRAFAYWVTARGGAELLHDSDAVVIGERAVADLPGTVTRELAGRTGLEHWWIERVETGFVPWSRAALKVLSAGPVTTGIAAPVEDVVRVNDRGVLRVLALGAPGTPAWVGLGFATPEEMRADIAEPLNAAAAALIATGERVELEAEAALLPLQQIDAPARIAELEAQLAAANSTIGLLTLLYPISQFLALGNPVLADGNPLLSGA